MREPGRTLIAAFLIKLSDDRFLLPIQQLPAELSLLQAISKEFDFLYETFDKCCRELSVGSSKYVHFPGSAQGPGPKPGPVTDSCDIGPLILGNPRD